jgi:SAM-dependent methyltransferase
MEIPGKLLSNRLREMWQSAAERGVPSQECAARQTGELEQCAAIWKDALLLPNEDDLVHSTLVEIGGWRGIDDLALVRRRCEDALQNLKLDWEGTVDRVEAPQVEKYYDSADGCIEELMWWHTLTEDNSPLSYVAALEFAKAAGCRAYLDFGSGVGSGALLFANNGFDVTLADISGVLLSFCRRRLEQRGRNAKFIDLKESKLPPAAFDFITAMDVFEHLVDPVGNIDLLHRSLKPGGYIYGRFSSDNDDDRPQHIVHDFQPVFDRLAELGCKEVFRDDWLWGHQVFQKAL